MVICLGPARAASFDTHPIHCTATLLDHLWYIIIIIITTTDPPLLHGQFTWLGTHWTSTGAYPSGPNISIRKEGEETGKEEEERGWGMTSTGQWKHRSSMVWLDTISELMSLTALNVAAIFRFVRTWAVWQETSHLHPYKRVHRKSQSALHISICLWKQKNHRTVVADGLMRQY